MASLVIDSPKDAVENRKNSVLISWLSETSGQVAYEFQFKPSTSTAWSTLGKVDGTSNSAYFDLSTLTDGLLYHYRMAIYYEHTDEVGVDYRITELSQAYSLVLTTNRLGILKIKTSELETEDTPLYDELNKSGPKIKVKIADNIIAMGSFNNSGEIADFQSDFKIKMTNESPKRTIREYGNFYYTAIESQSYRADRYTYLYFAPEKWDYAYDHNYLYYEIRTYSYYVRQASEQTGETIHYKTVTKTGTTVDWKEDTGWYNRYYTVYYYAGGGIIGQYTEYAGTSTYTYMKQYNREYSYTTTEYDYTERHYRKYNVYSYNWYLYMYYEYYYNVYMDHYNYGYDYTNYVYR